MQIQGLLRVTVSLALLACVLAQSTGITQSANITQSLEGYINEHQRQNDQRLKAYEDRLANFRNVYAKQLEPIDVQADSMQLKLEEASARLAPIAQIDSWSKECVQNYSSTIPTITAARTAITSCKAVISTILSPAESQYNLLKTQYTKTLPNALASCVKLYWNLKTNYTICVNNAIADNNRYTLANQDSFNANFHSAECTGTERINSSWRCTFKQVYTLSSAVEVALRAVDTCVEHQSVCGSVTCSSRCPHVTGIAIAGVIGRTTITNPFQAVTADMGCLEFRFT